MENIKQFDDEEIIEYFDDVFFDMDIDEQIKYLISNPDKKIDPEYVENDYFWELSEAVSEKGEKELAVTILKKYYDAVVELQDETYYRRVIPSFDAIYHYGMNLLNNTITPFEDIEIDIKRMFISFCIQNEYVEPEDFDDMLDAYPQLTTFYENLEEIAYADDDAMYPMLLRNVGKAYQVGTKYFKKDLEKAFRYFEIGSGMNYEGRQSVWPFQKVADCSFEVAACYKEGLGIEKNLDKALAYFDSGAAEYGLKAVPDMAEIYLDADFAWEEYFDNKVDLMIAAFDAYESSCNDYCKNETDSIKERIINEIKEFANNGNVDAKYRLAMAYEKGTFVEQNSELALKYHSEIMNTGKYPHSAIFYFANYTPEERESYQLPAELKVGDEFFFGELIDEPLKWKVVEIHEDGPVVISEKILAVLPYGDCYADFESSFVRKWLNQQFFQKVFTEAEQKCISEEEYYAISFSGDTYGKKINLKDYLFLPYSTNIESWYGEGKDEWKAIHTDFSLKTGNSKDCWLLDVDSESCPKHVNFNNSKSRMRYHVGCELGVRPIMILK